MEPLGSMSIRRSLGGVGWHLDFNLNPPSPLPADPTQLRQQGYRQIPATVPGCVEIDLMSAGLLPDLYVGENIRSAWDLEEGDWWYSTTFEVDDIQADYSLIFYGIDTFAQVFVNGSLVGETNNMFIEHELPLGDLVNQGSNTLVVHIASPLVRARQYEYPPLYAQVEGTLESLWVRKPAHMYGWDIAPRVVSAGFYRDIELVRRPLVRVKDFHLRTVAINHDLSTATLSFSYQANLPEEAHNVNLRLSATEPESGSCFSIQMPVGFAAGARTIEVENAQFWWPRGYGRQPLYSVVLELSVDGRVVDRHEWKYGVRTAEVDTVYEPFPDGRFRILVNAQQINVLGTNWVPLDALHSRDADRLPQALALLESSGCNMVRCWGGNVYESDAFYDWCDENGILVWQDFALACARYPQVELFQDIIRTEAHAVIRRLRRHASLTLWSGSNEDDDVYIDAGLDPNSDVITRKVLPESVNIYDPGRAYIVGSPAYSDVLVREGRLSPPEQHLWGERAWFKDPFYTSTNAMFVSEIGFHGSPSRSSLETFIPELRDTIDVEDPVWRLHETRQGQATQTRSLNRTQLMLDQTHLLFGSGAETSLDAFIPASQIAQAEALKFVVENSRLDDRRSGIIWWNLLDCWPQTSDSVVDYYMRPKLAFHFLKRAQRSISIIVDEADGWWHDVWLVSETRISSPVLYKVSGISSQEILLEGIAKPDCSKHRTLLGRVPRPLNGDECYLVEWEYDGQPFQSHYLCGTPPYDLDTYISVFLPKISAGSDGWSSTF